MIVTRGCRNKPTGTARKADIVASTPVWVRMEQSVTFRGRASCFARDALATLSVCDVALGLVCGVVHHLGSVDPVPLDTRILFKYT